MRVIFVVLFLFMAACSTEPEPLQYGKDTCHTCKMTLMDNKFGAEIVTDKGKIYKFDDMSCFLNYYNSGFEPQETFRHLLVTDYSNPGHLINGTDAFYLSSPEIRSPMNGQLASFEAKASMEEFKKQWNGIYLTWGEVRTQFK